MNIGRRLNRAAELRKRDEGSTNIRKFDVHFDEDEILVGVTLEDSLWGHLGCVGKIGFTIA